MPSPCWKFLPSPPCLSQSSPFAVGGGGRTGMARTPGPPGRMNIAPVRHLKDGRLVHPAHSWPWAGIALPAPALPQFSCLHPSLPLWKRQSKSLGTQNQHLAATTPWPKHHEPLHGPVSVSTLRKALDSPAAQLGKGPPDKVGLWDLLDPRLPSSLPTALGPSSLPP